MNQSFMTDSLLCATTHDTLFESVIQRVYSPLMQQQHHLVCLVRESRVGNFGSYTPEINVNFWRSCLSCDDDIQTGLPVKWRLSLYSQSSRCNGVMKENSLSIDVEGIESLSSLFFGWHYRNMIKMKILFLCHVMWKYLLLISWPSGWYSFLVFVVLVLNPNITSSSGLHVRFLMIQDSLLLLFPNISVSSSHPTLF
jgi:hypothetical protein